MKTLPALLLLLSANALANSPEQQRISEVYKSADAVVYAEVTSGTLAQSNQQNCGTKYRLRVIRTFKGSSMPYLDVTDRSQIVGVVGSKALVFLHKNDGFRPGDYPQFSGLNSFINACTTNVPEMRPAHVLVETYNPESRRDAFVVYEKLLVFPLSVPKLCAAENDDAFLYPAVIDQKDAFNYLDTLKDGT